MPKGVGGYVQITSEGMIDQHDHPEARGDQASQQGRQCCVELDVLHV